MIDQIPLHRDQFTEITVEDILNDLSLKKIAIDNYGYTEEYLELLKTDYKEIGLGFKLVNKLDRPGFIEVNIQHRINDSMLKNKFQRNASFAKTETLIYGKDITSLNGLVNINTIVPYQYGEEQLDVYINGRLIKKELINEYFKDIREKRKYYEAHVDEVKAILDDGTQRARNVSKKVLDDVRNIIGMY